MLTLLLATHNAHKTREFAEILGPEFSVSDLASMTDFAPAEETGKTFEENAVLKVEAASRLIAGFVVADDSGLVVEALNGEPGVRSARYSGENASDQKNITKLLGELESPEVRNRRAYFCCVLALARDGKTLAAFQGRVDGVIANSPRGKNGFGYDPVFIPDGFDRTFAELGDDTKNRVSHRARAIAQLREYLQRQVKA